MKTGSEILNSLNDLNKENKRIRRNQRVDRTNGADKVDTTRYVPKSNIMTRAELIMYKLLEGLLDKRARIAPKVRMADVVGVEGEYKAYHKIFKDIALKHIDFLVYNGETGEIICLLELDDIYHNKELNRRSDLIKNRVFKECNIKLFRVRKSINTVGENDLRELDREVNNYFAPKCTNCGREMEQRESKLGELFYGCKGFPNKCRNTADLSKQTNWGKADEI